MGIELLLLTLRLTGSLNIPYDTVIPKTNRKTAVSRKKAAGANTEIFVTIESKPESDGCTRSYNIRYATEHERFLLLYLLHLICS